MGFAAYLAYGMFSCDFFILQRSRNFMCSFYLGCTKYVFSLLSPDFNYIWMNKHICLAEIFYKTVNILYDPECTHIT